VEKKQSQKPVTTKTTKNTKGIIKAEKKYNRLVFMCFFVLFVSFVVKRKLGSLSKPLLSRSRQ